MSRRGCSLPANASGLDPHRASISSRFGQVTTDDLRITPYRLRHISMAIEILAWLRFTYIFEKWYP
jgi:hypothetical protein